jgi:hypothetical protein
MPNGLLASIDGHLVVFAVYAMCFFYYKYKQLKRGQLELPPFAANRSAKPVS